MKHCRNLDANIKRSLTGMRHRGRLIRERAMPTSPAFGRRANPQVVARPARPRTELPAPAQTRPAAPQPLEALAAPVDDQPSLEDELREWKRNRKSGFEMPW